MAAHSRKPGKIPPGRKRRPPLPKAHKTAESGQSRSNPESRAKDRLHDHRTIVEALRASAGVLSLAAAKLQISRVTLWRWISEDPELQKAQNEVRDELVDLAEGKLLEKIRDGSERSIHYFLDRHGKDRGYTVRQEITGKDGEPIETKADYASLSSDELMRQAAALREAAAALEAEA